MGLLLIFGGVSLGPAPDLYEPLAVLADPSPARMMFPDTYAAGATGDASVAGLVGDTNSAKVIGR